LSRVVNWQAVKVALPLDKRAWQPSVLPGQIVLVSTVDEEGRPNVAPKSWVTMVAFAGPIVAFGCNVTHATYRNVVATEELVVNVLSESLTKRAWALSDLHGEQRVRECGLTPVPAQIVHAPLVAECPAHLECELDDVKRYCDEVLIFGRVVAASIDEKYLGSPLAEQYEQLAPVFFLEAGTYARLGPMQRISD
jgi:flavin reductase (DIM6/NTAB) family NADH-FMN oxidoreductase RutF